MATYSNLGTTLITTGDEAGTWGDTTNTNLSNLGTAICGYLSVVCVAGNTVSANPLDLNVPNGTAGDGLNKILFFTSSGSVDLGANSYVRITKNSSSTAPYFEGWYFVRNSLSGNRSLIIFQGTFSSLSAGDYVTIPNGQDAIIYCGPDTTNPKVNLLYANPSFATLTTTSNAGIGGTLGVSGATTLSSTLETTGSVGIGGNPSGSYKVYTAAGSLGGFYTTTSGITLQYNVSTDSSSGGMSIIYFKDSSSPADGDDLTNLRFYGNDSGSNLTEYVRITAGIEDSADTSEDGDFKIYTAKAGSLQERVRYSSADGFYIVDGAFRAPDVYASTTGSAVNMVMSSSSGILQRSTSSIRYKNSVADAPYGLAEVMQLRPVTYKGNNDGDKVFGGFIAEEVHDIGLTQFVQYDDQNRPDALGYGNMVSLLTKAIQEQQAMIEDLKARVAALGG